MNQISKNQLTYKPVTMAEWADLQTLFEEPGEQNGCWCMYWRIKRADFNHMLGECNKQGLKEIIDSGKVPGLLAYFEGTPVGWVSVAPRQDYPVLDRSPTLKRFDEQPVWSIVCFFISKPFRQRGMIKFLIEAAIAFARENGAKIVEAYPVFPEVIKNPVNDMYMGTTSMFSKAGFEVVVQRSQRRPIMRYTIPG